VNNAKTVALQPVDPVTGRPRYLRMQHFSATHTTHCLCATCMAVPENLHLVCLLLVDRAAPMRAYARLVPATANPLDPLHRGCALCGQSILPQQPSPTTLVAQPTTEEIDNAPPC
jgi:hypothetical protein